MAARRPAVMHGGHGRRVAAPNIDQSGHTTSRKSARGARVEVITRGERRRSWTAEQKCQIVAESLGPELTPTEVARKYAIGSGQALHVATPIAQRAARRRDDARGAAVRPGRVDFAAATACTGRSG
jgi:transposase-like protein